ncbi:hypothetical protein LguiA_030527 [Lonicera macranthoides]
MPKLVELSREFYIWFLTRKIMGDIYTTIKCSSRPASVKKVGWPLAIQTIMFFDNLLELRSVRRLLFIFLDQFQSSELVCTDKPPLFKKATLNTVLVHKTMH